MNKKFDELAKGLAQSGTRRQALKKFGVGLALACFGLANKAWAGTKTCLPNGSVCKNDHQCCSGFCLRQRSRYGYTYVPTCHY
jgi:hypothetical protein